MGIIAKVAGGRMSSTLRNLVADPALGLTIRTGAQALDTAVTWVHTSELPDPTPFLEGGELLLTTGMRLEDPAAFVDRLVDAGIAALGFGVGIIHRTVPGGLVDAAARSGLPLVEVPRRTPFIAISKAVSRAVAAAEYAGLRWTSQAQQELAHAAGRQHGQAALVRKLAELLDAWVLLLDERAGAVHAAPSAAHARAEHLHGAVADLRRKQGPAATGFDLGGDEVSMQVLGRQGRGYLAVGRAEPFSTTDQHVINSAASLLTLAVEQAAAFDEARARLCSTALELLLRGRPVADVLTRLGEQLPGEPFHVVVVSDPRPAGLLTRWEAERPVGAGFLAARGDTVTGLVAAGPALDWLTERPEGAAGVSEPCDYTALEEGLRQAEHAHRAAGEGSAVHFGELSGSGVLDLLPAPAARGFAESLLGPLRGDEVLLTALRAWLQHHGQWDPAASRLGVHRHTLRNRVRKAGRLLGRDLDQPGARAELWFALQILDRSDR
ncbi:PucR family transcriptional regulator [Salinifilum aidingensis]